MADRGNQAEELVGPAIAGPLLAGLHDADAEIRIEALWALVALPLSAAPWWSVADYANATLTSKPARPVDERLAVIDATPWIPIASIRETVARLARGELDADEVVRVAASDAAGKMSVRHAADPDWRPVEPAGFTFYSDSERRRLSAANSELTVDELWTELRAESHSSSSESPAALVVTLLIERAGRALDAESGFSVVHWVEGRGLEFRPDLDGLFNEFRRLRNARLPALDRAAMFIRWQIGWLVSRGGLIRLLTGLDIHLTSREREERLAAFSFIQCAAAFAGKRGASTYGRGVGLDPVDPRPGIAPRTELLDEVDGAPTRLYLDDDVQFTVYRPTRVQPDRWYPLLAFAHRTEPIEDSAGDVMNPIDEVARQAASLLSGSAGSFDLVRADSEAGLRRGTDLLFEPWMEAGEINPPTVSLRWEEPIHRVEFRLRVPLSADGRRIKGGVRVFAGPLLIGEVSFHLPVSATATAANATSTRDTARRFRQIFASYSHRDAEVVEAVERHVTLTGDRYLIDVRSLRSGETWNVRLRELIDAADIFQLFWSRNAMNSPFVQQEWEYALQLSREGFVRPVYWEDPLPTDPKRNLPSEELLSLHFSRLGVDPLASATPPGVPPEDAAAAPTVTIGRIVCSTCGFPNENEVTQQFCLQCGALLEWAGRRVEPAPPALSPAAPAKAHTRASVLKEPPARTVEPGDLVCVDCGEGNHPSRMYCRRCGAALAHAPVLRPRWWRRVLPGRWRQDRPAEGRRSDADVRSHGRRLRTLGTVVLVVAVAVVVAIVVLV